MEVYKSVYDLMLSKAIDYGYVKQQVLDILTESHDRVDLSMFKNIPDAERYWMAERWTWETLFADESDEFPGEKPKWKRVTHYLKHKSPAAGETPKSTQVDASDSSISPKSKLENSLTARPQDLGGKTSEVKASAPKRIVCVDTSPKASSFKRAPKPKLTKNPEIANEKEPMFHEGFSSLATLLADMNRKSKAPAPKANKTSVTDA
ncbi:hypothetical protein BTUL_0101g00170 [Botrytis tulipae]|uniref:Uncharacterized protein n=1 Tax=Botrytis tulipae TaxID=87230 RepID=A0A4Z1EHJ7_9HELO|nr:hypothetical protein BTUL_0101g00170 [Botrytis tulipae]